MAMGPGIWEAMILLGIAGASILVPLVLVILLIVWLSNKKRRDNQMIESLIGIKQTLEEIRERMARQSENR